jgi:hypothetical protein
MDHNIPGKTDLFGKEQVPGQVRLPLLHRGPGAVMRDKTIGERIEDAVDTVFNAIGLLAALAVVATAIWAVAYCWVNHITVRDIGHTIISFVDDGKGDETGFVQAMRNVGYSDDANVALDAGHRICGRLRSDGSTPTDIANTFEMNRPAGINAAIWRKMTFDFVTNAQVYLCPDTLHNTGTPTPTTVTVTSTAPTATRAPTPTYPPTMVATTSAPTTPFQPDWAKYCREHPQDWVECGETGPNPVPSTPGGSLPPTPNEGADESPCRIPNQLGSCEETR